MLPWSFLLEVQRCQSGVSGVQSWGGGQSWEPWADRVCALTGQVLILFLGETSGSGFTSPPTSRSSMS